MNRSAFIAASRELAEELGQLPRREGDSWFMPVETDRSEKEHRIDLLAGRLYCTCRGFIEYDHCKHLAQIRRLLMNDTDAETRLIHVEDNTALPDVWRSPHDLARRLKDMRQERDLVQQFFKDVMIPSRPGEADGDYGVIPGTDKPTLFKAGAEKLCELYGYASIIADVQEYADYESGHYRAVIRMALVHKGSGVKIAEGIGECNTRESRYFYRWVWERDVPAGIDKSNLKQKSGTKNNRVWRLYRIQNDDLFSLWNTILKMAKKRALVDATLSATRSSGLFTQSAEHLDEWIDAEFRAVENSETPAPPARQSKSPPSQEAGNVAGTQAPAPVPADPIILTRPTPGDDKGFLPPAEIDALEAGLREARDRIEADEVQMRIFDPPTSSGTSTPPPAYPGTFRVQTPTQDEVRESLNKQKAHQGEVDAAVEKAASHREPHAFLLHDRDNMCGVCGLEVDNFRHRVDAGPTASEVIARFLKHQKPLTASVQAERIAKLRTVFGLTGSNISEEIRAMSPQRLGDVMAWLEQEGSHGN